VSGKIWALIMALLALTYVFLLGFKGLVMLPDPNLLVKVMGLAILVLPLFAIWAIWLEIRFGINAERLAKSNTLPGINLELRPSGRATKESAEQEVARLEIESQSTQDWQVWFRLGEALDASGERKAARAAIRKAIKLANDSKAL
jgi:cytochrome c-type biogenesis protein CcmH/NrfG